MSKKRLNQDQNDPAVAKKKAKIESQNKANEVPDYHYFLGLNSEGLSVVACFDKTSVADPTVLMKHVHAWMVAAEEKNDPGYIAYPLHYLLDGANSSYATKWDFEEYVDPTLMELVKAKKHGSWTYRRPDRAIMTVVGDTSSFTIYYEEFTVSI